MKKHTSQKYCRLNKKQKSLTLPINNHSLIDFYSVVIYVGGGMQKTLELFSGGPAPCSHRLLLLGECSRNPCVSVNRLTLLWEAAFSFSELGFWRLSVFAHFMVGDLRAHLPTSHWVLISFLTKNSITPMPHPSYSPDLTLRNFFLFPWMKKVLERETFCHVEKVKQTNRNSRSTKRHQNQWVQKLFWVVEKMCQ